MNYRFIVWVVLAILAAIKLYTKKKVDNIDGFGGITTRDEIEQAKKKR